MTSKSTVVTPGMVDRAYAAAQAEPSIFSDMELVMKDYLRVGLRAVEEELVGVWWEQLGGNRSDGLGRALMRLVDAGDELHDALCREFPTAYTLRTGEWMQARAEVRRLLPQWEDR